MIFDDAQSTTKGISSRSMVETLGTTSPRSILLISAYTDDVLEHCDLAIYVTRGEDGISRADGPR